MNQLFTLNSSLLTPEYFLLLKYWAFLADSLVACNSLAGATHASTEATAHSLLKGELTGGCARLMYSLKHRLGTAGVEVAVVCILHNVGNEALCSIGAVNGGNRNLGAESAELVFIEDLVLGVEAENYGDLFALFNELFAKHLHRGNANAAAEKHGSVARHACIVAVAESGKDVKSLARTHFCHLLGACTYNLVDKGEDIALTVADRDGTAQEESVELDVNELTAVCYVTRVALKKHLIDVARERHVFFYSKD